MNCLIKPCLTSYCAKPSEATKPIPVIHRNMAGGQGILSVGKKTAARAVAESGHHKSHNGFVNLKCQLLAETKAYLFIYIYIYTFIFVRDFPHTSQLFRQG